MPRVRDDGGDENKMITADMDRLTSEDSLFRVLATARGRVCEHIA